MKGPADELILTSAARDLRRALGPTAWVVLEELTAEAMAVGDETVVHTTVGQLAEALGLGRDAVGGALQALALSGWVRNQPTRGSGGRFGAGRYLISRSDALRPVPPVAVTRAERAVPIARVPRKTRATPPSPTPNQPPAQLTLLDLTDTTPSPSPTSTPTP